MGYIKTFEAFGLSSVNITYKMIEEVTKGYIETALWTAELDNLSYSDVSLADVKNCQKDVRYLLNLLNDKRYLKELLKETDLSTIGHCFWLNRNGHGSGFWDQPTIDSDLGNEVSELVKANFVEVPDPVLDEETGLAEFY